MWLRFHAPTAAAEWIDPRSTNPHSFPPGWSRCLEGIVSEFQSLLDPDFCLISLSRFRPWPDYTPHSFCQLPPTPRAALTLEPKRPSCRRVSSLCILLKTSDRSAIRAAVSPSWQTIELTRRRAAVKGTLFLYGLSSQKGEYSIYTTCTNTLHYLIAIRWCMTIKSPAETFLFFFKFLPETSRLLQAHFMCVCVRDQRLYFLSKPLNN